MKLLVVGATGGTGRWLVEQALHQGHWVTAAARDPRAQTLRHDRLRTVQCDVQDPAAVRAAVAGHDIVLCALGGTRSGVTVYSTGARAIVDAMHAHGVRRLVFLSNFGVMDEKGHGIVTRTLLGIAKLALKDVLEDHRRALDTLRSSNLEWVAIRPMVLTNANGTRQYRVASDGLPRGGSHIARADLAHFMLQASVSNEFVAMTPAISY